MKAYRKTDKYKAYKKAYMKAYYQRKKRRQNMKTKGMFWHIHHDVLVEWSDNIQERIDYIKKEKPENEIETRLHLLKPVEGKLPEEFIKAGENYAKAEENLDKAGENFDKAWEKYDKACENFDKAWEKYKPAIKALHKKECNCKEWNREKLVFKK